MKQGLGAEKKELVQSKTKWLAIDTNERLQERIQKSSPSTSTIIECSTVSHMNSDKSWIVNYGSSLRKKKTSIICVSNLPSLPWNTTGKVQRASGNRCLHDADKTRPPRKAVAAAASATAILCQYIREQSPFT